VGPRSAGLPQRGRSRSAKISEGPPRPRHLP